MRFVEVRLHAPADAAAEVRAFYAERLGFPGGDGDSLRVGETAVRFAPGDAAPFYHVAFLVPGDRYDAALRWSRERVELLPDPHTGDVVFDFPAWDARALYFHDPAESIVELIAHRGLGDTGRHGPFAASELVGVSEVGLVGDPEAITRRLGRELGLKLWDGHGGRLGFVGSPARTFVVSALGRGWLPTGRPAEIHPVEVVIDGPRSGTAELEDGRYRISAR